MDLPDTSYDNDRGLLTSPTLPMRRGVSTSSESGPSRQSLVSHLRQKETDIKVVLPASPGTTLLQGAPDLSPPVPSQMKTMLVVEQNVSKQFATKRFSTSGKQINLRNRQLVAIVKFKSVNYT